MANNKEISSTIKEAINQSIPPAVFFISDFPEYGHEYVRKVLSSMVQTGDLMRLANGIYVKPKMTKFGPLQPSTEVVVKAIAAHDSAKVLPAGTTAENMLGLSTQVPMNYVYLTDGSARVIQLGNTTIKMKRAVPKIFAIQNYNLAVLCLAMKSIGENNITEEQMGVIRTIVVGEMNKEGFSEDILRMPMWIQKIVNNIKIENK